MLPTAPCVVLVVLNVSCLWFLDRHQVVLHCVESEPARSHRGNKMYETQFSHSLTCRAEMDVQNSHLYGLLLMVVACLVKIPSMT